MEKAVLMSCLLVLSSVALFILTRQVTFPITHHPPAHSYRPSCWLSFLTVGGHVPPVVPLAAPSRRAKRKSR